MPRWILYSIYFLMVAVGLVAMYTILNAGNPESFLRRWFPNPGHDVFVAMITSFIVFVMGFVVFFNRDREGFQNLVQLNANKIRQLRQSGSDDEAIAESILNAMGSRSGRKHVMAKRKLVIYLAEFK